MTVKIHTYTNKKYALVDLVKRLLDEEKGIIIFYTESGFLRLNSTIRITEDVVEDLAIFLAELVKDSDIDFTSN